LPGDFDDFLRAMLASSYGRRVGAYKSAPRNRDSASFLRGSWNIIAARMEASATLTAIPVFTENSYGIPFGGEVERADPFRGFFNAQGTPGDRVLQDGQHFTLERTVIAFRPTPELFDYIPRHLLYREIYEHDLWFLIGSILKPL
jgi:hypothetical protein